MPLFIDAVGLQDAQKYFEQAPARARRAAHYAINDTAQRSGLKLAREAMLEQVAFPKGYLYPPRFQVKERATDTKLQATIVGRYTPTPLARFAGAARTRFVKRTGAHRRRGTGVTVQIQPGHPTTLRRAFLLTLRNGNIGLGVRLRPGEVLAHSVGAKLIPSGPLKGVYLLYGPSVDQVFRTVAVDISPPLLSDLYAEFLRQFVRLENG